MKRRSVSQNTQSYKAPPLIFEDVENKFAPGSIQCIKLRNFMTFEKMTISPSPGLNLIIGPNGTGKSSIVCAIGLGLGSSPQVLARTSKISGFIRHSCEFAKIKILLTGDPPFWVYRRINADNTTQWKIRRVNGSWKQTSSADVLQRIQALHIQLDNLCMFLPQERVKEFSTLRPNQLLSATEQAINKESYNAHLLLVRDFQQLRDSRQRLTDLRANLTKFQTQCDQMKAEVHRFKQAEECKADIERHEKKIPWVAFQAERDAKVQIKAELKAKVTEYKEIGKAKIKPLTEKIEALKRQRGDSSKAKGDVNTSKALVKKLQEELFTNGNKLQTTKSKLSVLEEELETKKRKIDQLQSVLDQQEGRSQAGDTMEELRAQRSRLQKELQQEKLREGEFHQQKQMIDQKLKSKNSKLKEVDAKMRQFENQKNRLLEHLKTRLKRHEEYQLYQWIDRHRNEFFDEVHGPVCIETRFPDAQNANLLQKVVENRYLFSFVCRDKRDYETISRSVNENRLNQVTLLRSRDTRSQRPPPRDLSEYGFTHYCDSLFEAPEMVKTMLCQLIQLDRVPVGSGRRARESIRMLTDRVFRQDGINRYFIDNIFYLVYPSRSGGSSTICSSSVGPSSIWRETLAQNEDMQNLHDKRAKIQESISRLEEQASEMKRQTSEYAASIRQLTERLQQAKDEIASRNQVESRMNQFKEKIKQLDEECRAMPEKKAKLAKARNDYVEQQILICEKWKQAIQKAMSAQYELDKITVQEHDLSTKLAELQEELQEERAKYSSLEREILELNEQKSRKDELIKQRKAEAEKICPLTEENKAMMAKLSGDLEVLKAELARLKGRYNALSQINPAIAQRYAEAQKNCSETQAAIEELQAKVEAMDADVTKRFNDWKTLLSSDVSKINAAFQELMETCKYRGEVKLDCDEKDKIETYRLNLLVAFNRLAQLNVLSSTRQSGGEKSVTTLLYLLALQDCTKFPFRVVDEINQGMDEVNDRNTFFQVMSYAMRRNQASQYFLVTPKLLPQLDLMDGVTVLVVMNGPYIPDELNMPITFRNSFGQQDE